MEVEASILLGLGRRRWDGKEAEAAGSCGTDCRGGIMNRNKAVV